MMSRLAFAALFCATHAATLTWTGIINDQQWTTPNNWYPAQVPTAADDVVINDAESKDATVVLVQPMAVKSLTVGAGDATVRLRVLAGLMVRDTVVVAKNGVMEVNSGAAAVSCNNVSVAGELEFAAGTLVGKYAVSGLANFGGPAAKVFNGAAVTVASQQKVIASGSLQFKGNSAVTATTGVKSSGQNTQFIAMDETKANSFVAHGFSWVQ